MASRKIQTPLRESLRAFVGERHPFGLPAVLGAFDALNATDLSRARAHLRKVLPDAIRTHLTSLAFPGVETTPGVTSETRVVQAAAGLIEGVELPDQFAVGVQWHPEMFAPGGTGVGRLFADFVDAAGRDDTARLA